MIKLTSEQERLFQSANFGALSTLRADGSPHTSPVWVDFDGERVVINTAVGRAKERHLRRDPRASISVSSFEDPYRYVEVSGRVEFVDEDAEAHIDAMAKKYLGLDEYPNRSPGEVRVIAKLTPERVGEQ